MNCHPLVKPGHAEVSALCECLMAQLGAGVRDSKATSALELIGRKRLGVLQLTFAKLVYVSIRSSERGTLFHDIQIRVLCRHIKHALQVQRLPNSKGG